MGLRRDVGGERYCLCLRRTGAFQKNQEVSAMSRTQWLLLGALTLPLSIGAANAAVDPEKLPQVPCSDVKFSAAFLAKWPKAPAACQDARVYKGQTYAKFQAKVYISSPEFMTVQILDSAGGTVTTASFKPGPDQGVHVNGKLKKFHDMSVGEILTFWVSEKRTDAQELPDSTTNSWALLPPL
jgi:hypothetical protein